MLLTNHRCFKLRCVEPLIRNSDGHGPCRLSSLSPPPYLAINQSSRPLAAPSSGFLSAPPSSCASPPPLLLRWQRQTQLCPSPTPAETAEADTALSLPPPAETAEAGTALSLPHSCRDGRGRDSSVPPPLLLRRQRQAQLCPSPPPARGVACSAPPRRLRARP